MSLGVFGLHLTAGIMAVGYRRAAPALFIAYAALALAHVAWKAFTWYRMFGDIGGMTAGNGMMIVPVIGWPITALVLMTRPTTRAACNA
jgi:hypothetical protein